ncbi:bifunctional homocysteine S-methyltransferase/methylenetetrahydrofolate reductase [Methylacidiphilum caldifontis]|uniref:Bifunctional homocysteine S-methyltransferase/methylenetetrahydrofolate reductase n=1 Tax=Methylacidiphilum caldifontis TaxID=2795386 RepID=A0A4Y8PHE5_9BACT|nr:bifunctional homocysteine S-methyltransferase/methylenetetrahydrofolate reductase [Methylacidiphilum caldifontis]TFE72090.1 bifunctional homocysteine S-methyltransferase/methylenetetrahydrofolate reductase [Methylacidiphilum caldifontis]
MATLIERLNESLLIGDGALGTYLYSLGVPRNYCIEELNLSQPYLVEKALKDYIDAGSQIIRTNTAEANLYYLSFFKLENKIKEIIGKSIELARRALGSREGWIAGTVSPIWIKPADPPIDLSTRRHLYEEQISLLLEGGCDLLFFETFTDLSDLLLALELARNKGARLIFAFVASFEEGKLASGESVGEAFSKLREAGASLVGINGATGVQASIHLLEEIEKKENELLGVYPNAGKPEFYEGKLTYSASPSYFGQNVLRFVEEGVCLLGGDYGTEPVHIAAMAQAAVGLKPVKRKAPKLRLRYEVSEKETLPQVEESLLERLNKKPIFLVEYDSPKTLTMGKFIEGVKAIERAGADAITLADNSLAILRVSNFAAAIHVRRVSNLIPVLHVACRDRNLLGLQSELMGLGTLGFRHVLALTGDPAKSGDHPGATSVYDLNSIGLIRLLSGLNRGVNAAGKDLKGKTDFIIGCAFNPNTAQFDVQVRKLEAKLAAGASFVMTQPVFDFELVKKIFSYLKPLGIPVFVGLMPILNYRNAEFLHNEVPGISIPEEIRNRLRKLEGEKATETGVEFAKALGEQILSHFNALYLITPFFRYDISVRLLESLHAKAPV